MNRAIRFLLAYLIMGSALLPVCIAQDTGGQSQPQQGQGQGGQPSGGRPGGSQPTAPDRTNPPSQFPDTTPRPLFLSGSVRLTDGSVPPSTVLIERVCNGRVRPEGYTDSKGNFSFQVGGQPGIAFADASVGNASPFEGFGSDSGLQGNVSPRELTGCEIRANLAGFQSSTIMLTFRQALDDPDIGMIHLRPLANVEGFTFSVTTGTAPKDARNAYEKGLGNAKKQKWPDAERDFLKAVQVYPKYAVAWYELGRVYQQEKKLDDAVRAQNEAIKIDPKYISPYGQLALLSAVQNKWDDVVVYSSQVMKLNPDVTPDVYFYSAVAHYNLQKLDIAKDHARRASKLDTQHRNPRINHLLGVILAQTQEYKEAAENLKLYLKLTPSAPDAAAVNEMLAEISKTTGIE
jgi:tetratricopeptide (TPR) repeat protein